MSEAAYWALIHSDRVSTRTRTALLERAEPEGPAAKPTALDPAELETLRAVIARIVPQSAMDMAIRLDAALAAGSGDGWRFATLPPDRDAYKQALATLDAAAQAHHGQPFAALPGQDQDALLAAAAEGSLESPGPLEALQLQQWFEDARGDAAKLYVAHPATLARMGYSGIAYGGDGARKPGFHALEPGEREPWEPLAIPGGGA